MQNEAKRHIITVRGCNLYNLLETETENDIETENSFVLGGIMDKELQQSRSLHIENDKWYCPYLLASSFHNLIQFKGSTYNNGVLYWQFSPQDKALELIEQLRTKTEPPIPAKDIFEAIDTFWRQVAKSKYR